MKKLTALFMSVWLVLCMSAFNNAPSTVTPVSQTDVTLILGDVDDSGKVDAQDALMALQAATSRITLNEQQVWTANVDTDQQVTANDALLILQYATKKIIAFPRELANPTPSLVYERDGDTYTVTGIGDETVVVIPESYEGIPVTAIRGHHGTGAFARKNIVSVTIPDSITEIGSNTFNNCSELKEVMISENSRLTSIGNNAFSGDSSLESIYIPKGVTLIGDSAFNNCGALGGITVAADNAVYSSDGNCLIEKETGTLIRGTNVTVIPNSVTSIAQAAFRRSSITEITVPISVTDIGNYVFQNTPIISINYEGTTAQWNSITKARLWNMGIDSAKIYCTDGVLNVDGTEFQPPVTEGKTLIVYFSWSSNTERMANTIKEQTGGDLLELVPVNAYPTDYTACTEVALAERDSNARPAIQNLPSSIEEYDNILIGYPIWWHTAPMIIGTFLETYDLTGVDVYPFTQSASMDRTQFNNSMEFVRACAEEATVHDGLFARYSDTATITAYLNTHNLTK